MVGRPKKELTTEQINQVRQAAAQCTDESGRIIIGQVAQKLGVVWQTARRWLKQCDLLEEMNVRLDRPGLVWPKIKVITKYVSAIVEAPNWAVACQVVEDMGDGIKIEQIEMVDLDTEPDIDRERVKELCPGYMDRTLSVKDLMQKYVDKGVMVRM